MKFIVLCSIIINRDSCPIRVPRINTVRATNHFGGVGATVPGLMKRNIKFKKKSFCLSLKPLSKEENKKCHVGVFRVPKFIQISDNFPIQNCASL